MISTETLLQLGAELDLSLEGLIERATDFVSAQTGRYFGPPKTETFYVTAVGGRNLWLPEVPANPGDEPTTIIAADYPGAAGVELVRGEDFVVRADNREARLVRIGSGALWRAGCEYEVAYEVGYETGEGPGDVRQLVIDLCMLRISERGSEGIRSESIGQDYQYTRFAPGDLTAIPGARATIEAWKRPVFA